MDTRADAACPGRLSNCAGCMQSRGRARRVPEYYDCDCAQCRSDLGCQESVFTLSHIYRIRTPIIVFSKVLTIVKNDNVTVSQCCQCTRAPRVSAQVKHEKQFSVRSMALRGDNDETLEVCLTQDPDTAVDTDDVCSSCPPACNDPHCVACLQKCPHTDYPQYPRRKQFKYKQGSHHLSCSGPLSV